MREYEGVVSLTAVLPSCLKWTVRRTPECSLHVKQTFASYRLIRWRRRSLKETVVTKIMKKYSDFMSLTLNYLIDESSTSPRLIETVPHNGPLPKIKKKK